MRRVEAAKTFMFVCIGLLALTAALQLVTTSATAQSTEPTTVAACSINQSNSRTNVVMSNGDVYQCHNTTEATNWQFKANIFEEAGVIPTAD